MGTQFKKFFYWESITNRTASSRPSVRQSQTKIPSRKSHVSMKCEWAPNKYTKIKTSFLIGEETSLYCSSERLYHHSMLKTRHRVDSEIPVKCFVLRAPLLIISHSLVPLIHVRISLTDVPPIPWKLKKLLSQFSSWCKNKCYDIISKIKTYSTILCKSSCPSCSCLSLSNWKNG